jgi:hypothetical protein
VCVLRKITLLFYPYVIFLSTSNSSTSTYRFEMPSGELISLKDLLCTCLLTVWGVSDIIGQVLSSGALNVREKGDRSRVTAGCYDDPQTEADRLTER